MSVDDDERLAEVACLAEERREGVIGDSLSKHSEEVLTFTLIKATSLIHFNFRNHAEQALWIPPLLVQA